MNMFHFLSSLNKNQEELLKAYKLISTYYQNPKEVVEMIAQRPSIVAIDGESNLKGVFTYDLSTLNKQTFVYLGLIITQRNSSKIALTMLQKLKQKLLHYKEQKKEAIYCYGHISNLVAYNLVTAVFDNVYPKPGLPKEKPDFYNDVILKTGFEAFDDQPYRLRSSSSVAVYQKDYLSKVQESNYPIVSRFGFGLDLSSQERLLLMFEI